MNTEDITEDEAILKIKKMKKEEPAKYQNEMNEWFDAVHPSCGLLLNLTVKICERIRTMEKRIETFRGLLINNVRGINGF